MAREETLTAEYEGHNLEVIASLQRKEKPPTQFELWIDGAKVDSSGWGLKSSQAEPVLQGELPGGAPVAVHIQGGKVRVGRYTLTVDGKPLLLAIQRGRSR